MPRTLARYAVSKTKIILYTWCFFDLILTWVLECKRPLGRPFVFAGERFLDQEGTILSQDWRVKAAFGVNRRSKSTDKNINYKIWFSLLIYIFWLNNLLLCSGRSIHVFSFTSHICSVYSSFLCFCSFTSIRLSSFICSRLEKYLQKVLRRSSEYLVQ